MRPINSPIPEAPPVISTFLPLKLLIVLIVLILQCFSETDLQQSKPCMKHSLLFFVSLLLIFPFSSKSQNMNQSLMDPVKQRPVLIDSVDRNGLLTGEMGEFFQEDYHNYTPDSSIVDEIEARISGIVIHVVFGSWCGDSKEQVPHFLKLIDQLKTVPEIYFTAVDSEKKGRRVDVSNLNIERVPTFIIYRNHNEIGRIVETPDESLEKDLLGILQNP